MLILSRRLIDAGAGCCHKWCAAVRWQGDIHEHAALFFGDEEFALSLTSERYKLRP